MYTCESILLDNECLDGWIRQEYVRSKANRVQNSGMSKDGYENGKGGIKWALVSRNQLLDWCWVANEETAMCL